MQFSQDFLQHNFIIRSVSSAGFQIGEQFYPYSVWIPHTGDCRPSPINTLADLTDTLLSTLLAEHPDILLIGTGEASAFLKPALLAQCWEARVGVECMTTPAAARTYNVLANEGRKVAVLLIK